MLYFEPSYKKDDSWFSFFKKAFLRKQSRQSSFSDNTNNKHNL